MISRLLSVLVLGALFASPLHAVTVDGLFSAAVPVADRSSAETERGVGDLTAILFGGRHVEIEAKASDGRLSDDQRARAERLMSVRAAYVVVRSGDETRTALDAVASGATLWPPAGDPVWSPPKKRGVKR
jgi:hypothetical protein